MNTPRVKENKISQICNTKTLHRFYFSIYSIFTRSLNWVSGYNEAGLALAHVTLKLVHAIYINVLEEKLDNVL